jgi:septal ring factor EnvC (AmiA/AmiB activator)
MTAMTATRLSLRSSARLRWPVVLCLLLSVGVASAADDKKAARMQQERIQHMQQAQQALEQEKTQLGTEKAALDTQLRSTKSELERAKAQARRSAADAKELERVRAEREAQTRRLAELEASLAQTQQKLQTSTESDLQARRSLQQAQRELEQKGKALQTCETNNQGLYKLNTDLLARYEKSAKTGSWLGGSALTRLGQVPLENERTQLGDQLDSLKVQPAAKP